MVFVFWTRPSTQQQNACLSKSGSFNYDTKYRGATSKPLSTLKQEHKEEMSKDGVYIIHARVLLGSGIQTFEKAKVALQNWRHLGVDWGFVDSNTPIRNGQKLCICAKTLVLWFVLPLEVVYVIDVGDSEKGVAAFKFAVGSLKGNLLGGEQQYSVELDEKNEVWYKVMSISKPKHLISIMGYPYVRFMQKRFAHHSAKSLLKHVKSS